MTEPLQGQKTSILAGLFVLLQGAHAAGFVSDGEKALGEQLLALVVPFTLALKARRAVKGS